MFYICVEGGLVWFYCARNLVGGICFLLEYICKKRYWWKIKMSKWIKVAQQDEMDKKYREWRRLESLSRKDKPGDFTHSKAAFQLRQEIAIETVKRANSVLSGTKNIDGMKVNFIDMPFRTSRSVPIKYSKFISNSGRLTVLADINGVRVPFYISTGQSGKENVAVGKWYAFFGEHEEGWMNKGQQDEINSSYGSKKLAAIENWLDANLNFIKNSNAEDDPEFSPMLPSSPDNNVFARESDHLPLINRDMKPASSSTHNWISGSPEKRRELESMTPKQKNELIRKHNDDFKENVRQLLEKLDRATDPNNISSPADVLKNYIVSQCKGDAYEIFLWSEGKSEVNNPPVEIRNIVMGMNPKITGLNHYIFDNVDAVNYFKAWVPMKTLGDEAFEYILNNNEEYLELYRNWGKPTPIQNVEMHAKDENLENDPDTDRMRLKAKEEMKKPSMLKSSKAIRKIRF